MIRFLVALVCLVAIMPTGLGFAQIDKRPWREAPAVWQNVVQAEVDAKAAPFMMVAVWEPGRRFSLAAAGTPSIGSKDVFTPQTILPLDGLRPFLDTIWAWRAIQSGTIALSDTLSDGSMTVREALRSAQSDNMHLLETWLETRTGMTFQQAVDEELFGELDEKHLGFPLPEREKDHVALSYISDQAETGWKPVETPEVVQADLYDVMLLVRSVFDKNAPLFSSTRRKWLVFDDLNKPGQSLGALSRLDQAMGTVWITGGEGHGSSFGLVYAPLSHVYFFGFANAATPRLSVVLGQIVALAAQSVSDPEPISKAAAKAKVNVLPASKQLELSWQNGFFQPEQYTVYLSRNEKEVRQGDFSAKILTTKQRTAQTSQLLPGTRYYWRVDSLKGTRCVPGPVWSFTTGYIDLSEEK